MVKGLNQVVNKLNNLKNSQLIIRRLFFEKTANYIINQATEILLTRLDNPLNTFDSDIVDKDSPNRCWDIDYTDNKVTITNKFDNSASVEFGIGVVGQNSPHSEASNAGYVYNVASPAKDTLGRWTFIEQNTGQLYFKYSGYKGKSFLYDSLVEYYFQKMWGKLYEEAFAEVFKKL